MHCMDRVNFRAGEPSDIRSDFIKRRSVGKRVLTFREGALGITSETVLDAEGLVSAFDIIGEKRLAVL